VAIYKRGDVFWYKFRFAGRTIRESAKTGLKTLAKKAEEKRRRELELGFNNLTDERAQRVQRLSSVAESYLCEYVLRHRSKQFARYAIGHITRHLGEKLVVDISDQTVRDYQSSRLKEKAAPKTINEEVGFLLRLLGDKGDAIRLNMRREKTLKLKMRRKAGKAYSKEEKVALLEAAETGDPSTGSKAKSGTRSPFIKPAISLALNAGMRNAEIRTLTWG
jgi:integrase